MSISPSFDTGALRIRLMTAEDKVKAFESGEKYVQMQEQFKATFREQNARIRKLEGELGKAHAQTVNVRKIWSEIFDDVYKEADAGKFVLRKEIARLEQRVLEVERQRDDALDRLRDKNHELYEVKSALYEAEQKIAGLTARINKDYTNSSKSSSQSPDHKTIPNGREKSGRKPGGQKGHIHHGRKHMEPTEVIAIPAPSIYRDDPNFKETGNTIRKQLVKLHVGVEVVEYHTPEFRNQTTGQRVHAAFPEGLKDEVTYEVLEEATKGFLGFGSKNARILVTEVFNPEKIGKTFLTGVFEKMGLETKIVVSEKDCYLVFDVQGDNLGILIGRRGDTLDALQFLLNLVINRKGSEKVKAIIDIENYRAKREETLISLSKKLADKARRTGQRVILEPMNPQERRIIHMTLQEEEGINTYSEGVEPYRKVVIVPKRKGYKNRN